MAEQDTQQFSRSLRWLQTALAMLEQETPRELFVGSVLPVVDVVQGGWPFASVGYNTDTSAAAPAAGTQRQLLNTDSDELRYVQVCVQMSAAAAGDIYFGLELDDLTSGAPTRSVRIGTMRIAAGRLRGGGADFGRELFRLPPNFALYIVNDDALAAGVTYTTRMLTWSIPLGAGIAAGYQPLG